MFVVLKPNINQLVRHRENEFYYSKIVASPFENSYLFEKHFLNIQELPEK